MKGTYLKKAVLNETVDFRCRRSLSAGRQVSLLVATLLRSLTLAANPAGVECLPLQSTGAKNSMSFNTALKKREKNSLLQIVGISYCYTFIGLGWVLSFIFSEFLPGS
jgi:hypothetical protein